VYDDGYTVEEMKKAQVESKKNPFMDGYFVEILRFDSLDYSSGALSDKSKEYLTSVTKTIKSRLEDKKEILISVIGHADRKEDDGLSEESFRQSEKYTQEVIEYLIDQNISSEILVPEHRAAQDIAYTMSTQSDRDLSKRVMISMYVLAPKDKDSDGDGVFDSIDKCPDTLQGVKVDEKGCPFDSDADGVLDYNDKCPGTISGLKVDADGCPIHKDLRLNFAHNSSEISSDVYYQVEEFAQFLKENPAYNAEIIGHTDSVGKTGYNMNLSLERANAVKDALIQEGVSSERLNTVGRGELSPIETNRTAAGRAKNRRIEVKLYN
jgi:outer membrane protein OmpA-like peptidoglycan-associated protein